MRDLAQMVCDIVPGSRVRYAEGGGPDPRCYRVNCDKLARVLPAFQPQWTVRAGMTQLHEAFRRHRLTHDEFVGDRFLRIKHVLKLQADAQIDASLRWASAPMLTTSRSAVAGQS